MSQKSSEITGGEKIKAPIRPYWSGLELQPAPSPFPMLAYKNREYSCANMSLHRLDVSLQACSHQGGFSHLPPAATLCLNKSICRPTRKWIFCVSCLCAVAPVHSRSLTASLTHCWRVRAQSEGRLHTSVSSWLLFKLNWDVINHLWRIPTRRPQLRNGCKPLHLLHDHATTIRNLSFIPVSSTLCVSLKKTWIQKTARAPTGRVQVMMCCR